MIDPIAKSPVPEADRIEGVLEPAGYRVLVQILPPEETARRWQDSGLHMPDEVREREQAAQLWATVIALGPDAYKDEKRFPSGAWCKPGDAVVIRPYAGTRFSVRGQLYALINDDTVQGVVTGDPGEIERP
jgi:co-chaperonin GroES (HSP10)